VVKKIRNIFIGLQYFSIDASPRTYIPKEAGLHKTFLLSFFPVVHACNLFIASYIQLAVS